MIVTLKAIDSLLTVIVQAAEFLSVFTVNLVKLSLVLLINIFKGVKEILLSSWVMLLQRLNLSSEHIILADELLLVQPVLICILLDAHRCLCDCDL